MQKLKHSQIKSVRDAILKAQGYRCVLCEASLRATAVKDPVLDHDHDGGHIRGVLCRNCNQMEGKVKTSSTRAVGSARRLEWLGRLCEYLKQHAEPQLPYLHPTHKTAEDKRLERNRKARERAAKLRKARSK